MAKHSRGPLPKKMKKSLSRLVKAGSNEEVLVADVKALLDAQNRSEGHPDQADLPAYVPPERFTEIDVTISELSSTGDGLGVSENSNHVFVVPFTAPGDVVRAKLVNYKSSGNYTLSDFISVLRPSPMRDDSRVKCPYFSKCGGCQFQMMSYDDQLAHKKKILERAYKNFSDLTPEVIPQVGNVIGSPMPYGYRTKLTPHFDRPPGYRRRQKDAERPSFEEVPPIGFMNKGVPKTLDIEDCPIGTDAVREGLKYERQRVTKEISKYKKGATLLLRESTVRTPKVNETSQNALSEGILSNDKAAEHAIDPQRQTLVSSTIDVPYSEKKVCITDPNGTSTEYVDDYVFTNPAGSFFQNNNSILPSFTSYIRKHILGASSTSKPTITNLIDAYSGSGLFTITLSQLFESSIGIDVSPQSIASATRNAELNKVSNARFVAATASAIFADIKSHPDETAVVIDPPRKGCDEEFLSQLLDFGPRRVVYVSCNVHTQARDIGVLVEGRFGVRLRNGSDRSTDATNIERKTRYKIESLIGFDFFPQTSHVEGVAVLERIDNDEGQVVTEST